METKIVYRIENPEDKDGMWYTKDGILRKKIHILCPDGIAKDFPMPFNPIHKKDGHIWQSAGKNIENMNQWFTASDAINLFNNGFKLFEFETTMFQELEMEVLFCRKGVMKQREIPLESIWDIASVIGALRVAANVFINTINIIKMETTKLLLKMHKQPKTRKKQSGKLHGNGEA